MNLFSQHIPPEFLKNPNVLGFITVLDNLQYTKNAEINRLENFLNFYNQLDLYSQKKFLSTLGEIPQFSFLTKSQFIKLVENSFQIWSYKGSKIGLDAFFTVFGFTYVIESNTNLWAPVIFQFDDPLYGLLPDGVALGDAASTPNAYPYMVADNLSMYYNRFVLSVSNTQTILNTTAKRKEFAAFLPKIIAMADARTCNYSINFKDASNTLIETLNF